MNKPKITEEEIKKIIDWKSYNFLMHKLTVYEDNDNIIELNIVINNIVVYVYFTDDGLKFSYDDASYQNLNIVAPYQVSYRISAMTAEGKGYMTVQSYFPCVFWSELENTGRFRLIRDTGVTLYIEPIK